MSGWVEIWQQSKASHDNDQPFDLRAARVGNFPLLEYIGVMIVFTSP